MILLSCPECDKRLKVQDSSAGKLVQCPGCKTRIRVAAAQEPGPAAPPKARSLTSAGRATSPEPGLRSGKPPSGRRMPERSVEREEFDEEVEREERDEEYERPRKRRKKKTRKGSEYSPLPAVLVCLGVAGAIYAVLVLWAAFARGGGLALLIGGGILFVCARIWFIFIARQEDVLTYLLVRFVPFYSIYYFFTRLHDTYKPFILGSVGATFAITGFVALVLRDGFGGFMHPERFQAAAFAAPAPGRPGQAAPGNPAVAVPAGKHNVIFKKDDQLTAADPRDRVLNESHRKVYEIALKAGRTYVIDMASSEFDAFLRLEDSAGNQLAQDDDGGGGLNARLLFTAPRDGTYHIIATSLEEDVGRYTVTVQELEQANKGP